MTCTGDGRTSSTRPWWDTPARAPAGFRPAPRRAPPWEAGGGSGMRSWRGARVILIGHRLRPCPDTLPRRTVSRTMQRAQPLRRLPASQQTEPSQPTIPRCGAPSSLSPDRQARADLPLTVDAHTPVARHTPSPQGLVLAALRTTWPRPLAEPAAAPCRLRSQLEGHPVDPSPPARPCCAAQGVRDGRAGGASRTRSGRPVLGGRFRGAFKRTRALRWPAGQAVPLCPTK